MNTASAANTTDRTDIALALLRVAAGAVFAAHGAQKVFVYGFAAVTGAFGGMGIPMPGVVGPLTAVVELVGGLALLIGLFTRLAGVGLAAVMLGAIVFVHLKAGFIAQGGAEFPVTLLACALALAVAGAGRFSLDAMRARSAA